MKRTVFVISILIFALIGLSSCEKDGGSNASSLEGTFVLQTVEGECLVEPKPGYESSVSRSQTTYTIDFVSQTITNSSWDGILPTIPLEQAGDIMPYIPSHMEYVFKKNGTALCSAGLFDPQTIEFFGSDRITISTKYTVKKGVLELSASLGSSSIGTPVSYKILSNTDTELVLEATKKTLKILSERMNDMYENTYFTQSFSHAKSTYKKQ